MLQQDSNASTVLTWVRPDLDKHLTGIRNQIEHIANSRDPGNGIETINQHLTQLKYTFEALVLQGATFVFDEMIKVCGALQNDSVRDRSLAFGALMDAIVVVPSYLDRLQAGHHDLPVLLLPVINTLRQAYNANVVSEATLFAPNLDVPLPALEKNPAAVGTDSPNNADEPIRMLASRLRRQYENALLMWLQDQHDTQLLSPLHSVCETLRRRLERKALRRMWWIAAEVIGGLLDGVIDGDVHVHRLFARLNLVLKTLAEGGEDAVVDASVDAISQALLFHVAQSKSGSPGLDMLRDCFRLETLVPDRDALIRARGAVSGRNRGLYDALGAAVRDELSLVKDALDLEQRTGHVDTDRRQQSLAALLRLNDTLKMMGLSDSARSIAQLLPAFEVDRKPESEPSGSSLPDQSLLLELAEKLIQVESVLEEQIETLGEPLNITPEEKLIDLPMHEFHRFRVQLLNETVVSLHQVQAGVHRHFDGDEDADYRSPLEHIAGALEMLGELESADLALQLRNALDNLLRPLRFESAIDPEQLNLLTDAVAAFELFLAGCRDQQQNRDRFLQIFKDRLGHLPTDATEAQLSLTASATASREKSAPVLKVDPPAATDDQLPRALEAGFESVFLQEYEAVVSMLEQQLPHWMQAPENETPMIEIRRGFHTLKGSGRMVGAHELADFSWHIEELLSALLNEKTEALDEAVALIRLAVAVLPELKLRLLQKSTDLQAQAIILISEQAERVSRGKTPHWHQLRQQLPARLGELLPGSVADSTRHPASDTGATRLEADPEGTPENRLCRELADSLAVLNGLMDSILKDRNTNTSDAQMCAIKAIAETMALKPLGREPDIARALEGLLVAQHHSRKPFSDDAVWAIGTSLEYLHTSLDNRLGGAPAKPLEDEGTQIEQLLALRVEYETQVKMDLPTVTRVATTRAADKEPESAASGVEPLPRESTHESAVDTEILAIFLEEAVEVLARSDTLLNTWRDDLSNLDLVQSLQREIHTFKGGARMSGVGAMGDLSHAMESLLERIASLMLPPSVSAIEALEQGCDRLSTWVDQARTGVIPQAGEALQLFEQQVAALRAVPVAPPVPMQASGPQTPTPGKLQKIPDVIAVDEQEPPAGSQAHGEATSAQQIRVDARLLDSLVNAAGEISIFRSRMERQVVQLRENLKESDDTIARLREQFRKLEIEIETQIHSRYLADAPTETEEFDPLEMDRFSSIQQLSRSLSETVSDLVSLQELLDGAARKSETLLVQQSRVSTDLQAGLMQTRMVHFGSIAPRLRRIVRTAASETGKKARLHLRMTGGGDELDRNVLERITSPLEHLLRNAVVHGIESSRERASAGKPEEGLISITVAAQATEFIIRVEDDGAGLNLEAIRDRAIEAGLLDEKARPQPQQLMQLILHSGFTTSKKVTGLAGRGVGMDVVNSEIKQIGGTTEIESEPGKGSRFTIRIPFTLAVMQAIGVLAGEHRYLIPLSSVAGVARILPADYQQLLAADSPSYRFADEQFTVLELEPLLGEPVTPVGDDTISILLIKSGKHRAAFRVPQLLGHREIVIKPVGPQISSVPGILGGTITGDGQVVIIIDSGPLIRQALLTGARPAPPMETLDIRPKRPLAMVVDDSITMRKVTSRVLESHDFEVITARDGIDATEQMRERVPNVLLLDVEMPRMDGYAVAEHVRADARLRHIPIVMITSRAGEKHRKRGTRAGANVYLAKPYKESELIFEVNRLLGSKDREDG